MLISSEKEFYNIFKIFKDLEKTIASNYSGSYATNLVTLDEKVVEFANVSNKVRSTKKFLQKRLKSIQSLKIWLLLIFSRIKHKRSGLV